MIEERLKNIQTPSSEAAMERAVGRAERLVGHQPPRTHRRRSWTLWLPTAAIAVAIGVSPIGAAIADSVGDLASVGEEPSQPISLNEPGGTKGEENVVADVDSTPAGQNYEVATTTSDGQTCAYLSFPELDGTPPSTLSCITQAVLRSLDANPIAPATIRRIPTGRTDGLVVRAVASPLVDSAESSYIDKEGIQHDLEVSVAPIEAAPAVPPELAPDIKGHVPLQFLVAFLTRDQAESLDSDTPIGIRAFDKQGDILDVRLIDPPAWTESLAD